MQNEGGDSPLYLLLTRSCLKKYVGPSLSLRSLRHSDIVWHGPRRNLERAELEIIFCKVRLGAGTRGMICLCLQVSRAVLEQREQKRSVWS